MDPLLALLEGQNDPTQDEPEDEARPTIDTAATLVTLNYFENEWPKETWFQSNTGLTLQFYSQTQRFTPHFSLADIVCTAQLHQPDYVHRYVENYRAENKDTKSVPTEEQLDWMSKLVNGSVALDPNARLGQIYDKMGGGTHYHWGSIARLRTNKMDELVIDLFVNGEKYITEKLIEPNTDKNPKTANIKWRGRYDPNNLWKPKAARKKKS